MRARSYHGVGPISHREVQKGEHRVFEAAKIITIDPIVLCHVTIQVDASKHQYANQGQSQCARFEMRHL